MSGRSMSIDDGSDPSVRTSTCRTYRSSERPSSRPGGLRREPRRSARELLRREKRETGCWYARSRRGARGERRAARRGRDRETDARNLRRRDLRSLLRGHRARPPDQIVRDRREQNVTVTLPSRRSLPRRSRRSRAPGSAEGAPPEQAELAALIQERVRSRMDQARARLEAAQAALEAGQARRTTISRTRAPVLRRGQRTSPGRSPTSKRCQSARPGAPQGRRAPPPACAGLHPARYPGNLRKMADDSRGARVIRELGLGRTPPDLGGTCCTWSRRRCRCASGDPSHAADTPTARRWPR